MSNPLDRYRRDITSQCGEDGIIEHLLTLLPDTPKTCLEVGAGDGANLSNTNTLWTQKAWRALLIEGVPLGVELIEKRAAGNKNVTAVCAFITPTGANSIDAIIKRTNFPAHLGVLSLDIDSNDLEVLENLNDTTADIVIIEFNHEIPASIDYRDLPGDVFFRHSAKAVERVGKAKGYRLVACTGPNAVLVREAAIKGEAANHLPAVPVEQAFDNAFVEGRRKLRSVVQSKFITEELATVGKPSPLLSAYVKTNVLIRKLRRKSRGKSPGAEITQPRRENLRRAGLWI
ncbi:MAG: hypothetical protein JNL06_09350 [Alphaproteobacteria bacterium]|nr:hypothetical protein [Alphaproteobacteria bacterium]